MQATPADVRGAQRTRVIWLIPDALLDRVRILASEEHRSVPGQVAALLEEALKARDVAEVAEAA